MVVDSSIQRIARLTPLRDVLAFVEARVTAVKPRERRVAAALGRVLAADVVGSERPLRPVALRDGYAVAATAIADAGPYAPVPFSSPPPRVDAGDALPAGTDAVAPLDAVNVMDGNRAEALAAVAPGEGVLPAGGDAAPHTPLRRTGQRLRVTDVAVIAAAGIDHVKIHEPRLRIVGAGAANPLLDAALDIFIHAVTNAGAMALDGRKDAMAFDAALTETRSDAVIAIGGTGSGRQDSSVLALARLGRVETHGIGVSPGTSAAFGFVGTRPVLLVPGRVDATLAIWLLIGRHLVARLSGSAIDEATPTMPLQRKVASTIGLTELVPVTLADGMAVPFASSYLSLQALARSDGWIVIPADSEGYAAGTPVAVGSWP